MNSNDLPDHSWSLIRDFTFEWFAHWSASHMQTTFLYIHCTSSKSDSFPSKTIPLDEQFNSLSNLVMIFKTIGIIFLEFKLSTLKSIVFVFSLLHNYALPQRTAVVQYSGRCHTHLLEKLLSVHFSCHQTLSFHIVKLYNTIPCPMHVSQSQQFTFTGGAMAVSRGLNIFHLY
jgi:hypothetical protein